MEWPTEGRATMCDGCPFNPERVGPPIDHDTRVRVAERIRDGEKWVCHQTCNGAWLTSESELCAGAPA